MDNSTSKGRALANRLRRTLNGPMWHGPAVHELLTGVSASEAAERPIAESHTIWELTLHIAVWAEIARARLTGGARNSPPPELDFPVAPDTPTDQAWSAAQQRLAASYNALADDVMVMSSEQLGAMVKGQEYHALEMVSGVVEHGTYHGGQIAVLKRAMMRDPV